MTDTILELRKIQLCELEILKKFARFCDENNLKYVLIGGTLLGAIRHKGFIPWDDDIDVAMPRPDYEKFIKIVKEKSIDENLIVVSGDLDKSFTLPFTKILHKKYMIIDENRTHEGEGDLLWIDVMPIDGVGDEYEVAKKIITNATHLQKSLGRSSSVPWKRRPGENGVYGTLRCMFRQFYRLRGFGYYKEKLICLGKKHTFNESRYVAIVVSGFYGYGEIVDKEKFMNYEKVEFENSSFWTMGCWNDYLKGIYGNYMQLPPEEKRICPHNLKVKEHE